MQDFIPALILMFDIYVIVTIVFLLLDNREPSTTFAWIFVFIFFPVIGVIPYILFGRKWRKMNRRMRLTQQLVEERLTRVLYPLIGSQNQERENLRNKINSPLKLKLVRLLLHDNANSILTRVNNVEIIQNGRTKFARLTEDLKNAQHSIHMEYFIWRSDVLTKEIKKILIQKASEGVEVRIAYDALGSFFLSWNYIRQLRKAGVKIQAYLSSFKFHTINYRNHRKIVVIDGKIGYTGGMNMGQEYIDGGKHFPMWRDTHLRFEGEAALALQGIFTTGWYNTAKEDIFQAKYFPPIEKSDSNLPIQLTTSGPDSQWPSIKHLFFSLITSAENRVFIQSPYFIPDPSIFMALKTAALSGIDVRLMVTGVPDKKLPYWSAFTYFKDLLEAGVKIYHYNKGFLHSKTVVIDGEISSVGTANMDIRSFHLNYELNTLMYDSPTARQLEADFERDILDCREFTLEDYAKLSEPAKFRNSLARLWTPLL